MIVQHERQGSVNALDCSSALRISSEDGSATNERLVRFIEETLIRKTSPLSPVVEQ